MNTCKKCIYRIWDEELGQYKCDIYQHVIRKPKQRIDCDSYYEEAATDDSSGN